MKDSCEDCGAKPEIPDDDLVECHGCGKTICLNDCVWDSDFDRDLFWCGDCDSSDDPRENQ